jgi:hypothetical protein
MAVNVNTGEVDNDLNNFLARVAGEQTPLAHAACSPVSHAIDVAVRRGRTIGLVQGFWLGFAVACVVFAAAYMLLK